MKKNETSLAIIIGLLCGGISLPTKAQELISPEETIAPEIISDTNILEDFSVPVEISEAIEKSDEQIVVPEPIPTPMVEPDTMPAPSNELEQMPEQVIESETTETAPKETLPDKTSEITYTWTDFVAGKHCTSGDKFGTENKEITNLIFSYCNYPKGDAWQKWLNTFRSAKKDFLVQQDMKETNLFIRYLKIIPHLLFEVHNTQNKKTDTLGKLDQIESFILKRNTAETIEYIQSIQNDSLRLALQPVLNEGKNLLKIQNELEKPTGEAKND